MSPNDAFWGLETQMSLKGLPPHPSFLVLKKKEHTVQDIVSHGVSEEQRKLRAVGAAWLFAVQDVVVSRSRA